MTYDELTASRLRQKIKSLHRQDKFYAAEGYESQLADLEWKIANGVKEEKPEPIKESVTTKINNMYKLTGTVKTIKETVQVTGSFSKREFVINDASSMYPQDILFQSVQDKCSMLDGYNEGDNVEISFNLRGREWTSPQGEVKYFNTLDAWKIEKVGAVQNEVHVLDPKANDDDLPF